MHKLHSAKSIVANLEGCFLRVLPPWGSLLARIIMRFASTMLVALVAIATGQAFSAVPFAARMRVAQRSGTSSLELQHESFEEYLKWCAAGDRRPTAQIEAERLSARNKVLLVPTSSCTVFAHKP
jgi:hypothetical protein